MSAELSSNTHQSYQLFYDQLVVGWGVPQKPEQVDQAFDDAAKVLKLDKDCARFFGVTNQRSLNNLLRNLNALRRNAKYDETVRTDAQTEGKGRRAIITFGPYFLNDGAIRSNVTYAPQDPRPYRAHSALHEAAHALNRIPGDAHSFDQQLENNKTISKECARGLSTLQ